MSDRFDFYFEQLVTQADLDEAFDFAENADHALQSDNGYVGIVQGQDVSQAFPTPNLTVDVSAGVAYDQLGQRCFISSTQNVDLSVDSNAVPTSVAGAGNEKWISLFVAFDRVLSDPRVDGNGTPLQYRREESFQFVVDQGAEALAGTPAIYTSTIAETYPLVNGETLEISVGNTAPVTVTFVSGDFVNIALATAAEVAAVIQANVPGVTAADNAGFVEITTLGTGPAASVVVTGGNAAVKFGFPQSPATGAGGPSRPALRPDAILLADVLIRFGTTQIFDSPDGGAVTGVIDAATRREAVFTFQGQQFKITDGTITEFANSLIAELNTHINSLGNPHPASAISVDSAPLPALWGDLKVAPEVQSALLALTTDLGKQAGTVGAALIGADAAGPDLAAPGTLDAALALLDSSKGSLANPNTWLAQNSFSLGTTMNVSAHVENGKFLHTPREFNDSDNWTFVAGGLGPNPVQYLGETFQHTLGAGPTTYNQLLWDGTAAPAFTSIGMIDGMVMLWDDNSLPVDSTLYTFRVLFYLSAGAGQTVQFTSQFEAAVALGAGASDSTGVAVFATAADGQIHLQTNWGANAGAKRNIVTNWRVTYFVNAQ